MVVHSSHFDTFIRTHDTEFAHCGSPRRFDPDPVPVQTRLPYQSTPPVFFNATKLHSFSTSYQSYKVTTRRTP